MHDFTSLHLQSEIAQIPYFPLLSLQRLVYAGSPGHFRYFESRFPWPLILTPSLQHLTLSAYDFGQSSLILEALLAVAPHLRSLTLKLDVPLPSWEPMFASCISLTLEVAFICSRP